MSKIRVLPLSVEKVLIDESRLEEIGVHARRLKNGILILGAARGATDTRQVGIVANFPFGARSDPPELPGISHALEHMLPSGIEEVAYSHIVDINASTGIDDFLFKADALSPERMVSFIPELATMLKDPLKYHGKNIAKHFPGEMARIKNEIHRLLNDEKRSNQRTYNELIWAPDNPRRLFITGTVETIEKLTLEDLKKHQEKYLIPHGLIFHVFTPGTKETLMKVMDALEGNMASFPRSDIIHGPLSREPLNHVNSGLIPGSDHEINSGYPKNQANAMMGWLFHIEEYTTQSVAISHLAAILERRLKMFIRNNGGIESYSAGNWSFGTQKNKLIGIDISLAKESLTKLGVIHVTDLRHFFIEKVLPHILFDISPEEIGEYLKRKQADETDGIPIPLISYLEGAIGGIREYGKPVDTHEVRKVRLSVTVDEVLAVKEKMNQSNAITVLMGDLAVMKQ